MEKLKSVKEVGVRAWKHELLRQEIVMQDKGCPLNMFVGKHKLREWLTSVIRENNVDMMVKVCCVRVILASYFGEDIDFGNNDYSAEAVFYNKMSMSSQHVLDM